MATVRATSSLTVPDAETLRDLTTYISRARRVDPDGACRMVAGGGVLAVYVSPVHGAPGPTVLGLRAVGLADGAAELDATVPLAALGDRLAAASQDAVELPVPPMRTTDATWAGVSPPRTGWDLRTALDPADLVSASRAGIEEIAAAVPEAVGGHVVAQVRAVVWGRELPTLHGVAAGAAYAADSLGFLDPEQPVAVRQAGPWWRLSTTRGHVLVRTALL
ncbi:MAG: hypothetical protein ACJ71T_01150 [Actinomycetales bacterium]